MSQEEKKGDGSAAFSSTFLQAQIQELAQAVTAASLRFQEMLCAAFTVKHGYCPIVATRRGEMVVWVEHPPEGERMSREEAEQRLGTDLELLATRYRTITDLAPDEACVEMVQEGDTVEIRFARKR